MESIDVAFDRLKILSEDIKKYQDTICTEQDTRVKVIDRMFTEVLGWHLDELKTEEATGNGTGFLDYKFTVTGLARLIVEAKRDGRDLEVSTRDSGRAYKLNGTVFQGPTTKEGIHQAIGYCAMKGAELACVTNGREWIIFRGNRVSDGKDTLEGKAFIFPTLEAVLQDFSNFYDLLSREAVENLKFRALFRQAEGLPLRARMAPKAIRSTGSIHFLTQGAFSRDLDRIMAAFFQRLADESDPELLNKCFVTTKESDEADLKLARISEDLIGRVRSLDTVSAEGLTDLIERLRSTKRNQFVVVVGIKGAGKTTFIERFFEHIIEKSLKDQCIIVRIDVAKSGGDEGTMTDWMNKNLLAALEEAVFADVQPTYDELMGGLFFTDYQRWSMGEQKHLYEKDKEQFKIEFGKYMQRKREEDPYEYICRLLRDIVHNRKKVPIILFDNVDHFSPELQEKIFHYARSIYEQEVCMIIMPITDKTSWLLSPDGALQSFENEFLYLPAPPLKIILQKRIDFLQEHLDPRQTSDYFTAKGFRLTVGDLSGFIACLNAVLLTTGSVADWISSLANGNVRRCLEISRDIMISPHLEIDEWMKAFYAKDSYVVPSYKITNAMIKEKYDVYPTGKHKFIQNIFILDSDTETSPLLGIRILQLLSDVYNSHQEEKYISVEDVLQYFHMMTVEAHIVYLWLSKFLDTGLCFSYDPTVLRIENVQKIEISPSGSQHLRWAKGDRDYIQSMIDVTPISDAAVFTQLTTYSRFRYNWKESLSCFINYLVKEDKLYCQVPNHGANKNQSCLTDDLLGLIPNLTPTPHSKTKTIEEIKDNILTASMRRAAN